MISQNFMVSECAMQQNLFLLEKILTRSDPMEACCTLHSSMSMLISYLRTPMNSAVNPKTKQGVGCNHPMAEAQHVKGNTTQDVDAWVGSCLF